MGAPMARHLLAAGYPLTVHSRSAPPVDALVAEGARRAPTPAEVASAVRRRDHDGARHAGRRARAVRRGRRGRGRGGRLARDRHEHDRPDPHARVRRAARSRTTSRCSTRRSPAARSAPRPGPCRSWSGGPDEAFARARPLFEAMGSTIVHVGPSGAGQVAKACNQLVIASAVEAVGEAFVLAAKAGVDPAKVREALLGGFASSKVLDLHGQRMLDHAFEPGFRSALMAKDGRIVVSAADGARGADPGVPRRRRTARGDAPRRPGRPRLRRARHAPRGRGGRRPPAEP